MKVLLVKPDWSRPDGREQVRYASAVKFPALALGILAALSQGHDVRVADANWEEIPLDGQFDLVGITVHTFSAVRAFEIAARFRASGAKVVLGGVHAAICTDECLEHADAVVVGEAEYTWPRVLEDMETGRLQRLYTAPNPTDLRHMPLPQRELLREFDWFTAVEATRGCPNKCSYCYLPRVPWAVHRTRPVKVVAEEIRNLPQRAFIFVDENIFGDRDYAIELFRAIAPFKKFWLVQAPTNIAGDTELLDAMQAGGCFNVQVGFQSFNRKTLKEAVVTQNLQDALAANSQIEQYRAFVKDLRRRRIVVSGFFVFGFENDGTEVFADTVEMIKRVGIDDANLFVLTPFPGTPLYEKYKKEGRLLPDRAGMDFAWSRAIYQPKKMTPEELEQGVQWAYDQLYPHFRRKLKWVLWNQRSRLLFNLRFAWGVVEGNLRHSRVG